MSNIASGQQYTHRKVTVGYDWHIEVRGLRPTDDVELQELLQTLKKKHGWPTGRQVIVGPQEVGYGEPDSAGLLAYNKYVEKVRVGPDRDDVRITDRLTSTLD